MCIELDFIPKMKIDIRICGIKFNLFNDLNLIKSLKILIRSTPSFRTKKKINSKRCKKTIKCKQTRQSWCRVYDKLVSLSHCWTCCLAKTKITKKSCLFHAKNHDEIFLHRREEKATLLYQNLTDNFYGWDREGSMFDQIECRL